MIHQPCPACGYSYDGRIYILRAIAHGIKYDRIMEEINHPFDTRPMEWWNELQKDIKEYELTPSEVNYIMVESMR